MGFFSFCDHEWKYHKTERAGLFGGKSRTYHKCTKCDKTEVCSSERDYSGSMHYSSYGEYSCPKCGVGHGSERNG